MTQQIPLRNKILDIRLTEDEFKELQENFANSTKRNRSDYVRSRIMGKPITVYTRNKSIDDFLDEMIQLRRELAAIGSDFQLSVRKLQMTTQFPEIQAWAILQEKSKELLFKKIDEIDNKIIQLNNQWLPL